MTERIGNLLEAMNSDLESQLRYWKQYSHRSEPDQTEIMGKLNEIFHLAEKGGLVISLEVEKEAIDRNNPNTSPRMLQEIVATYGKEGEKSWVFKFSSKAKEPTVLGAVASGRQPYLKCYHLGPIKGAISEFEPRDIISIKLQ